MDLSQQALQKHFSNLNLKKAFFKFKIRFFNYWPKTEKRSNE